MTTIELMNRFEAETAEGFRSRFGDGCACRSRSIVYFSDTGDAWMTVCEEDGIDGWSYDLVMPSAGVRSSGHGFRTLRGAFAALNDELSHWTAA